LWLSVPYALRSWAIMERSQETGGLPLVFVLKTLIPVFALLMALQGIAQAIRAAASVLIPPALAGEGGERSEPGGGSANFDVTPPPAVTRRTLPLQGRD
jgi:TRAP-type mannitol/chloroaromatic compound transport system permease small subunit